VVAADPLNAAYPAEHSRQQITDGKLFNLPVATDGPDRRALQEARQDRQRSCRLCFHRKGERRGRGKGGDFHEIAPRSLNSIRPILQVTHLKNPSCGYRVGQPLRKSRFGRAVYAKII
jgi:hypothetical protein